MTSPTGSIPTGVVHPTTEQLEAGLPVIRRSPADGGTVELIVRRPEPGGREVLTEAELDVELGLIGDSWSRRGSRRTNDGGPHPEMQLNVMNARMIALLASEPAHQSRAGDQLYIDLDLSPANLPPGTRLTIGSAVIEVTAQPHRGCAKFRRWFGADAFHFVNSEAGQALRLRGINARVVESGTIRSGDLVHKRGDGPT